MNRTGITIQAFALCVMLIHAFPCIAASDSGETVTKRGDVSEDYYAAAGTVDIDATVIGDVVVAGGELYIGKEIQGDVMAAGGTIRIKGEVFDDIRSAGGDIEIDALIGDGLLLAGGKIRVTSDTNAAGEVWIAGGDVTMAGTVGKDLLVMAGNIRLSGTVLGDVVLHGGEIEILEGAVINGNLLYKSPQKATIHPDAKITGDVTYEKMEWDDYEGGSGIFFSLTLIVAAIVLYLMFPGFTISAAGRIASNPWKSLAIGVVALIITPLVAALFMGIVVGIWVGLALLCFYFVALITGLLISCFFLGDRAARILKKDASTTGRRLISVSLIIILLGLIQLVPLMGGLLVFVLLLLGLGAGILQLRINYSH